MQFAQLQKLNSCKQIAFLTLHAHIEGGELRIIVTSKRF